MNSTNCKTFKITTAYPNDHFKTKVTYIKKDCKKLYFSNCLSIAFLKTPVARCPGHEGEKVQHPGYHEKLQRIIHHPPVFPIVVSATAVNLFNFLLHQISWHI